MVASDQVGISGINKSGDVKIAGLKDFLQKKVDKQLNKMTKEGKTPFGTSIGGSAVGEDGLGNFSNPREVSMNVKGKDTKVASNYYSIEDKKNVINYQIKKRNDPNYKPKGYELDSLRRQTSPFTDRVDAKGNKIYSDTNTNTLGARDGSLIAMADTKVNETKREGSKFFSSAFNNEANSQTATDRTRMAGEGVFRSGISSEAFSPTVKPQYQINRERNRPNQNENVAEAGARTPFGSVNLNIARGVDTGSTTNQAEDTSFSSYVRGAKPGQERGNTRLAQARKVAKRNPNVSINKSTGRAEATNDSGKAKAQAAALNRKIKGGGKQQSRSERAKAAYRRNIKRGHKGTASASAANKASMRKRAKARHKASQARRKKRNKKSKKKCDIRCKFDIMPLTNMNLIRDDLAEVAYFVKEIQK